MTQFLIDLARWQEGINLTALTNTQVSWVNIKTSQGNWYLWDKAKFYADTARAVGLTVGTFHWLDNTAPGATQAEIAYTRMRDLGGPDGMFHQCDCEDSTKPATWNIIQDYVNAMQDKLGRHIVLYTGDWWWTADGRGWIANTLTPYLWAAPNDGYLTSYPGDNSPAWRAGYGGWQEYSILQYAVSPIAKVSGSNVSKSAIRYPAIMSSLTGTNLTGHFHACVNGP